jgi:hypothetical protein
LLFESKNASAVDVEQEAGVAEDVELLADFVADVVARVQLFEFAFEEAGVDGGFLLSSEAHADRA